MIYVEVRIWEKMVGILSWDEVRNTTSFEYAPDFVSTGIDLSPLLCPLSKKIVRIDANDHSQDGFQFTSSKGLPLFIADSLPDRFGTELFAKYLEKEGKNFKDLVPIEKLSYLGNRGMGALEFRPSQEQKNSNPKIDIQRMSQLASQILKDEPVANLKELGNLFHIGTSPGGAQPKVLVNIDRKTGIVYRGDTLPKENEDAWIVKFNKDIGLHSDSERGKVEFVYYQMARLAGITIMKSELLTINDDAYFITKRFDRQDGKKIHTQTLHAMAGMNFKLPNAYSYEQLFSVFNQLGLAYGAKEQLFRLMIFNVIGRNVDDHTKNFGFNLDESGQWDFSPAYDLSFSYSQNFNRETVHFLSINGKNEKHNMADVLKVAKEYGIKKPKNIINNVNQSFLQWEKLAKRVDISLERMDFIKSKLKTFAYLLK